MSEEKVVRYTAVDIARMRDDGLRRIASEALYPKARIAAIDAVDSVEFVAYADVAGLVSAMATLLDVIGRTHGRISPLNSSYKDAQAALARFQP